MNRITDLINTLSIQTTSYDSARMERFILKRLKNAGITISRDTYGNIYATKTDVSNANMPYPTIVCHIDTVHDINLNSIVRRHGDVLYSIDSKNYQRTGIGGDDKVGVWVALQCLHNMPHCKAVFFKDEEVGCVGSSKADFTFFDDSTIVLECDRQKMGDFVTQISGTTLCDDKLLDLIEPLLTKYGRATCSGGLTDVLQIANNTLVQTANINCGYYFPHTDNEVVSIEDACATLDFVLDVFDTVGYQELRVDERVNKYNYAYSRSNKYFTSAYDTYWDDWNGYPSTATKTVTKDVEPKHIKTCTAGNCSESNLVYDTYTDAWYCYHCDKYIPNEE